jgi:hypothetical protein
MARNDLHPPAKDTHPAIEAGGPGFAPDFAGAASGQAEFGPARQAGTLPAPSGPGFEEVTLNHPTGETNENRRRALFEREDSGTGGPHNLNRAFAGTYSKER